MCKYPVSNDGWADWILDLAVGYWVFAHFTLSPKSPWSPWSPFALAISSNSQSRSANQATRQFSRQAPRAPCASPASASSRPRLLCSACPCLNSFVPQQHLSPRQPFPRLLLRLRRLLAMANEMPRLLGDFLVLEIRVVGRRVKCPHKTKASL